MKVKTAEDLFKALVKAGVFMNTEDGVKAFAQLLITLNKNIQDGQSEFDCL